ncbi:MAG: TonB C-terminal domain-containing protein [Candidatus Dadabacteria bacterium]|nr:MAG: TonB C-terminal domain-containing protein [Candidatus Dadabacteria bacterium]
MTESTAKPQASVLAKPRAPAKATNGVSGRGGRGTQAGGSGGTLVRDAVFLRYYNEMIEAIRSHWVWVGSASAELSVTVRFSIAPDGTIVGVKRTSSSGNPHFDQSVENAIRSVGHLSPPPAKYRRDFADVELLFRASDLTRR